MGVTEVETIRKLGYLLEDRRGCKPKPIRIGQYRELFIKIPIHAFLVREPIKIKEGINHAL